MIDVSLDILQLSNCNKKIFFFFFLYFKSIAMELALLIKFTSILDKLACVSLLYTRAPIENRAENEKKKIK